MSSIEDKLVRFADKQRHQIFLEPESESLDTTYVQGFSTSMPHDVQEAMLHSLPGLENCVIKNMRMRLNMMQSILYSVNQP